MTLAEAQKVGEIVMHADGGCSTCVEELFGYLGAAFPFVWTYVDVTFQPFVPASFTVVPA